ncbi:DUF6037 family protein (plasmid) [Metabacillus halosaccharovorans]|uniref:DUF6037 family protein n=1 Tax=Metabacillus halosaccharovorans TaxID=930124 RepID=UPI0020416E2D|nr:DUF6037 family protein [Metabacillus halosaccharovorans]MCM3441558.1 DUF6037 family protein [Metabacillus halosaccharovorans]
MKLDALKAIYRSMKRQGINRYKFDFIYKSVKFDVFYFIDEIPNKLAFGIKVHNYYFETPVKKDFEIKAFIHEYNKFCKIMGFKYDPDNRYKATYFFEELNNKIPQNAMILNVPKPSQIAVYRNNIEESSKVYFVKWRDNTKAGHKVSHENLEKTRLLLSFEAYLMCKEKNISSCWSNNSNDERQFKLPNFEI